MIQLDANGQPEGEAVEFEGKVALHTYSEMPDQVLEYRYTGLKEQRWDFTWKMTPLERSRFLYLCAWMGMCQDWLLIAHWFVRANAYILGTMRLIMEDNDRSDSCAKLIHFGFRSYPQRL